MSEGSWPTPLSPTLGTRYLDLSPEAGTDSRRPCSTRLFTRSRWSVQWESSRSCAVKLAATISKIFPDWSRVHRRWRVAWPSSCSLWPAYLHWPDFLESFTFLALRSALAETTDYSGWLRWRSLAALSRSITT